MTRYSNCVIDVVPGGYYRSTPMLTRSMEPYTTVTSKTFRSPKDALAHATRFNPWCIFHSRSGIVNGKVCSVYYVINRRLQIRAQFTDYKTAFELCRELNSDEMDVLTVPDSPKKRHSHNSKPVRCIETGKVYENKHLAARDLGITPSSIHRIIRGKIANPRFHFENVSREEFAQLLGDET